MHIAFLLLEKGVTKFVVIRQFILYHITLVRCRRTDVSLCTLYNLFKRAKNDFGFQLILTL